MMDFFMWFTDMSNSKTVAAVIFFTTFVGILFYVFTGKRRKERFDEYRYIPFMDDEETHAELKKELEASKHEKNGNEKDNIA